VFSAEFLPPGPRTSPTRPGTTTITTARTALFFIGVVNAAYIGFFSAGQPVRENERSVASRRIPRLKVVGCRLSHTHLPMSGCHWWHGNQLSIYVIPCG